MDKGIQLDNKSHLNQKKKMLKNYVIIFFKSKKKKKLNNIYLFGFNWLFCVTQDEN